MPGENPFAYGRPVTGPSFTGREQELDALVSRVHSHLNVVVSSPRRYGKTSLLVRAEQRLAEDSPPAAVVAVNLLLCRDLDTLTGRLTAAAYRLPGARWHRSRQAIVEFVKRLRLRPQISISETGAPFFVFGGLAPQDADLVIEDVYGVLATEAEYRPAALVLDEFQAITRHGAHLPDLFKGLADQHPGVSLVIAGSQHHLMEELVFSHQAPLYGMADRLALGPIPEEEMRDFLVQRAAAAGKELRPETAALIVTVAGPVPNDIQRLAWETFNVAGTTMDDLDVACAFEQSVDRESSMFADRFAELAPSQARVLLGIADGAGLPIFSAAFARSVGLASGSSVKRVIDALEAAELIVRDADDRGFRLADPYFAEWLRRAQSDFGEQNFS